MPKSKRRSVLPPSIRAKRIKYALFNLNVGWPLDRWKAAVARGEPKGKELAALLAAFEIAAKRDPKARGALQQLKRKLVARVASLPHPGESLAADILAVVGEHDHSKGVVARSAPAPDEPPASSTDADKADSDEIVFAPDFTSATFQRRQYSFPRPKERTVCGELVKAWEDNTIERKRDFLTEKAGSDAAELRDLFRSNGRLNPAFRTIIVKGNAKDTYRLAARPRVLPG